MSPTYRKRRRDRQIERSRKGVAARERIRQERMKDCPGWRRCFTLLVVGHASPDGRHLALNAHGTPVWYRCGSERAVRAALAGMMWRRQTT